MASPDGMVNRQLFHELKQQYPEIPDYKVTELIIQHSNNKVKCLEVLAVESPKHIFGDNSSGAASENPNRPDFMDAQSSLQHTDSGASVKSSASADSLPSHVSGHVASLAMAWPPNVVNSNHNADSSASSGTDFNALPSTESGSPPSDFTQFMAHGKSARQIPNIQCNTQKCGPASHVVSRIGVPIQNYNTNSSWLQPKLYNVSNNDTVVTSMQNVQNVVSGVGANLSHNNNSNNMVSVGQFAVGPSAEHSSGGPSFSVTSPHHMSKATIYIQNQQPEDGYSMNPTCMSSVAIQPKLQINQPQMTSQGSQIPVHHFSSNQFVMATQRSEGKPLPAPRPSLVRNTSTPQPHLVKVYMSPVSSPTGAKTFSLGDSPPNFTYDGTVNPPDMPVRRDVMPSPSVPTMVYPVHTAFQSITATIPQTSSGGSPQGEDEPSSQYHMSAKVSPVSVKSVISSNSSHVDSSSHREHGSLRSASREEERDYIKALLSHQYVRKDKLEADLEKEMNKLEKIRSHVSQLEKNMADSSDGYPTMEALTKLRESNRKLLTEIQCMTREVDMFNQGRTPLGVWNPQDELFYSHLDQSPGTPVLNVGMGVSKSKTPPRSNSQGPVEVPKVTQTTSPHQVPPNPLPRPPKQPPRPPLPQITSVPPVPDPQPHVSSGDSEEGEQWSCSACTFLNHPALNKCECCEMPRVTLGSR